MCIGNYRSSPLFIKHGVPQGSILGPLFFNVYINDIVSIDASLKFIVYADDSTVLLSGPDEKALASKCNHVLEKLVFWSHSNCLKINPTKTKVLFFRAKNKSIKLEQVIYCDGHMIEVVNEYKILGVTFNSNLSWDTHVDNLCKKLSVSTGAMSRCRTILPLQVKIQIYHALFASHINYCSLVWLTTTQRNIARIYILQKKAVRNIANIDYLSSTEHYFESYNIMKINQMYAFRIMRSFYVSSPAIKHFITSIASLQQYSNPRTRSTDLWLIPRFRTFYKLQSLKHNLPSILNRYKDIGKPTLSSLRQIILKSSI